MRAAALALLLVCGAVLGFAGDIEVKALPP